MTTVRVVELEFHPKEQRGWRKFSPGYCLRVCIDVGDPGEVRKLLQSFWFSLRLLGLVRECGGFDKRDL